MNFFSQLSQLLQFNLDFNILFRFAFLIAAATSVIWLISNVYHRIVAQSFGRFGLLVTGAIGVPLHEVSHAVLAMIFGHKINRIVFFQFKQNEKTLGWVEHTYNKRNIYSSIGVVFISLAPILVIPVILQMSFAFFELESGESMGSLLYDWLYQDITPSLDLLIGSFLVDTKITLFSLIKNPLLFVVFGCISIHSAPSSADIKTVVQDYKSLFGLFCIPTVIYILAFINNGFYLFEFFRGMVLCCLLSALMFITSASFNVLILLMSKLKIMYYGK